jgi:hypothetical protein
MSKILIVMAAAMLIAAAALRFNGSSGVLGFGAADNFDTVAHLTVPEAARDITPPEWGGGVDLVRHSESFYLVGGVMVTDKGYALRAPGSDLYAELDEQKLAAMQRAGVIPNPAPQGGISMLTYLSGLSLWLILAVALPLAAVRFAMKRRKAAADGRVDTR